MRGGEGGVEEYLPYECYSSWRRLQIKCCKYFDDSFGTINLGVPVLSLVILSKFVARTWVFILFVSDGECIDAISGVVFWLGNGCHGMLPGMS